MAQVPIQDPVEGYFADGSFWFLNLEPLSFVQIDASTQRIVGQISSPVASVGSFAVDGPSLWVTDADGSRSCGGWTSAPAGRPHTTTTRRKGVAASTDPRSEQDRSGPAWDARSFAWIRAPATSRNGSRERAATTRSIIRTSGSRRGTSATSPRCRSATGRSSFRARNGWSRSIRLPMRSCTPRACPRAAKFVTGGGGFGWATSEAGNSVFQVSPRGYKVGEFSTGEGPESIAFDGDRLWVANYDSASVGWIDVASGTTGSLSGGSPGAGDRGGRRARGVHRRPRSGGRGPGRGPPRGCPAADVPRAVQHRLRSGVGDRPRHVPGGARHVSQAAEPARGRSTGGVGFATGGRRGDAGHLGGRSHLHVPRPRWVPLLAALWRAGHGRDVPVFPRARALAHARPEGARSEADRRHRRRGRLPSGARRTHLRPGDGGGHAHDHADRAVGRSPAAAGGSVLLSGPERYADLERGRGERDAGLGGSVLRDREHARRAPGPPGEPELRGRPLSRASTRSPLRTGLGPGRRRLPGRARRFRWIHRVLLGCAVLRSGSRRTRVPHHLPPGRAIGGAQRERTGVLGCQGPRRGRDRVRPVLLGSVLERAPYGRAHPSRSRRRRSGPLRHAPRPEGGRRADAGSGWVRDDRRPTVPSVPADRARRVRPGRTSSP